MFSVELQFCEHLKLLVLVLPGFVTSRIFPQSVPHKDSWVLVLAQEMQQMLAGRWECFFPWWPLMSSKHLRNPQPQELLICTFQSCVVTFLLPHYGIYLKGFVPSITNNINKKFFVWSLSYVHFQTTHTTQNIAYISILRFNILPCCWQCDFVTLDYKVKGCFVSDFWRVGILSWVGFTVQTQILFTFPALW